MTVVGLTVTTQGGSSSASVPVAAGAQGMLGTIGLGATPGGKGPALAAASQARLGGTLQVVRAFETGIPASWSQTAEAQYAQAGATVVMSVHGGVSTSAATQAALTALMMSCPPGTVVVNEHEIERPDKLITAAQGYALTGMTCDCRDVVNARRGPGTIEVCEVFEAWSLDPAAKRDISAYVNPRVDSLGFDCYATNQAALAAAASLKYGKPWRAPEWGAAGDGVGGPLAKDALLLPRTQLDMRTLSLVKPKPIDVAIFDTDNGEESGAYVRYPFTLAYLLGVFRTGVA